MIAGAGSQVAKKMLLIKGQSVVEPYLQQQGMIWVDAQPALKLVDPLGQLEQALLNSEAFFEKLLRKVALWRRK